jgi:hypothetical protein
MNEHSIVLLVCLVVIVILATLLYAAGWGYLAALAKFGELGTMLSMILANTHKMDLSLQQQRHVLNDAHKRISAVTKGVSKPAL